jgi:hypothetical protein
VLIDCWAWRVDSLLDGTLLILDGKGKELGYSGDYAGKDPFLDFTAPEDGDYVVKIWDFVYGGSADDVYRLQISSLPHIDAVIPAAVKPGAKTTVMILGRNLPGGKPVPGQPLEAITREIEAPKEAAQAASLATGEPIRPPQSTLDGMAYRLNTPEGSSNPVFLAFTEAPVLVEREPNNDRKSAQEVTVPCDITGSFAPAGDADWYSFRARKGEKIVVETYGDRQSGQIDPFFSAYDPAGKRLFSGDDVGGKNIGQLRFTTTTHDTRWELNPSADGQYYVQVRDLYYQQRGEPRFVYRLSIRHPRPDFRLVAVPTQEVLPDSTTIGQGGRGWLDVLVDRNDGFEDAIRIEANDLPKGVTCAPVVIGPGRTSVPLVFQAAKDAPIGHGRIRIAGKAMIDGREVTQTARGGGLTWPTVNTPGIARMADGVPIAVREASPFVVTAAPDSAKATAGDKFSFAVKLERASDWTGAVQLSGFDLPPGATVALVNVAAGATEAKVELALPKNLKPGDYSFTINGAGQAPKDYAGQRDPKKPRGNNVRAIFPSNAITITVVEAAKK